MRTVTLALADLDPSVRSAWQDLADAPAEPAPAAEPSVVLGAARAGVGPDALLTVQDGPALVFALPVRRCRGVLPALHGWRHPWGGTGGPLVAPGRVVEAWGWVVDALRNRHEERLLVLPSVAVHRPVAVGLERLLAQRGTAVRTVRTRGVPGLRGRRPRTPAAGPPVAGLPVAGLPVAGLPVAGLPVAGLPVAGLPVAGLPVTALPVTSPVGRVLGARALLAPWLDDPRAWLLAAGDVDRPDALQLQVGRGGVLHVLRVWATAGPRGAAAALALAAATADRVGPGDVVRAVAWPDAVPGWDRREAAATVVVPLRGVLPRLVTAGVPTVARR